MTHPMWGHDRRRRQFIGLAVGALIINIALFIGAVAVIALAARWVIG